MLRIATVIGTRPQYVKCALVSRRIAASNVLKEIVIDTGQHYDDSLSKIFFEQLEISPPAYQLLIGSGPHGAQTGRMLEAVEKVLLAERPDLVMVYGDTNSTLAGALAAAKLNIPVAHIEAGLRSFNRAMAEETNRVITDHISSFLFTPTAASDKNLLREGIPRERIFRVGDVMRDSATHFASAAAKASTVHADLNLTPNNYILATIHRAENTDEPSRLREVFGALDSLSKTLPVIISAHPRTRKALESLSWTSSSGTCRLIEPVGYFDMLTLEKSARLIVTDSGGVQKEAAFLGTPCLIVRSETEWTELLSEGSCELVPPGTSISSRAMRMLIAPKPAGDWAVHFGDGRAAERIVEILSTFASDSATQLQAKSICAE